MLKSMAPSIAPGSQHCSRGDPRRSRPRMSEVNGNSDDPRESVGARPSGFLALLNCEVANDYDNPPCMHHTGFSVRGILAGETPSDTPITVKGWVRTRRDSKVGISFVHLSDGSSFHPVQVVAPNALPNYVDEVLKLTAGCAIEATGTIVPSPAKGQPFEMQATAIKVIGWVEDPETYPIQPKPHSLEFLREVAHLRPRTNVIGAATRVRHTLAQAIHRFFSDNGFLWVNTPIITTSDAEGRVHCSGYRRWISPT